MQQKISELEKQRFAHIPTLTPTPTSVPVPAPAPIPVPVHVSAPVVVGPRYPFYLNRISSHIPHISSVHLGIFLILVGCCLNVFSLEFIVR